MDIIIAPTATDTQYFMSSAVFRTKPNTFYVVGPCATFCRRNNFVFLFVGDRNMGAGKPAEESAEEVVGDVTEAVLRHSSIHDVLHEFFSAFMERDASTFTADWGRENQNRRSFGIVAQTGSAAAAATVRT